MINRLMKKIAQGRTLPGLIQQTHLKGVTTGFMSTHPFESKRERDAFTIRTSLNEKTGELKEISVDFNYKRECRELSSKDEIYQLAKDFGGDSWLRLRLYNQKSEFSLDRDLFDITFSTYVYKKDGLAYELETGDCPKELFKQKEILVEVFDLLKTSYEIKGEEINISELQPNLDLSPKKVAEAYEILLNSGYVPCISNASVSQSFSYSNYPCSKKGILLSTLHLSRGEMLRRGKTITYQELDLIERTLRRNRANLRAHDFSYRTENILAEEGKVSISKKGTYKPNRFQLLIPELQTC